MSITAADIIDRFPEFSAVDPGEIDRYIAEAERNTNRAQWGGKADDSVAYLTAHLMSIFGATTTSGDACGCPGLDEPGPVTAEREGQVSAAYRVPDLYAKNEYGTTKYGRRYLTLLQTIFVTRCT